MLTWLPGRVLAQVDLLLGLIPGTLHKNMAWTCSVEAKVLHFCNALNSSRGIIKKTAPIIECDKLVAIVVTYKLGVVN